MASSDVRERGEVSRLGLDATRSVSRSPSPTQQNLAETAW